MEDQDQQQRQGSERASEPVRSRWTPKPEQILILESIFNSGMVNPPKDETVRIRKALEKFGAVGDANVFYWFQNRRSRSRRRQRQLQAAAESQHQLNQTQPAALSCPSAVPQMIHFQNNSSFGYQTSYSSSVSASSVNFFGCGGGGGGSSSGGGENSFYSQTVYTQEIEQQTSSFNCPSQTYQTGYVTVFINGVATEVPRGPVDIKAMFGEDKVLVHATGVAVPFNEFGFNLQHGESYFLVSRRG